MTDHFEAGVSIVQQPKYLFYQNFVGSILFLIFCWEIFVGGRNIFLTGNFEALEILFGGLLPLPLLCTNWRYLPKYLEIFVGNI